MFPQHRGERPGPALTPPDRADIGPPVSSPGRGGGTKCRRGRTARHATNRSGLAGPDALFPPGQGNAIPAAGCGGVPTAQPHRQPQRQRSERTASSGRRGRGGGCGCGRVCSGGEKRSAPLPPSGYSPSGGRNQARAHAPDRADIGPPVSSPGGGGSTKCRRGRSRTTRPAVASHRERTAGAQLAIRCEAPTSDKRRSLSQCVSQPRVKQPHRANPRPRGTPPPEGETRPRVFGPWRSRSRSRWRSPSTSAAQAITTPTASTPRGSSAPRRLGCRRRGAPPR